MTIQLTDARRHLRIDGTQDDGEIQQKLAVANEMVLAYVGHLRGDFADLNELPADVILSDDRRLRHESALDAARLLILGDLWQNRESSNGSPLSPGVVNVLNLFREPGYA